MSEFENEIISERVDDPNRIQRTEDSPLKVRDLRQRKIRAKCLKPINQ